MALTPGNRLGPYEILSPIGAGGMGEVYKATDTRLDRTVAIKVLPEHLAESPERKARFEREAKAISQLNHPHICTLYDVGEQDGVDFIVMEYIEGETLAERLKRGALPLEKALEYGIQIADGLDTAHRAGIVHRDLKPANAMLTKSGIKLLDFGLARLVEGDVGPETSDAPTRQKDLTKEESIIGTLQYMAPEQLERKPADARTDIFAFGVLLYEMVTGRKAFEGSSQASLIAAILEHEPVPIIKLQPLSPRTLDHVVTTCLTKDPERRWQTARDLTLELEWCREGGAASTVSAGAAARHPTRERLLVGVSVVLLLLLLWRWLLPSPVSDTPVTRFEIGLPPGQELTGFLDVSPGGRRLAYTAKDQLGPSRLYLRSFDSFEARLVENTEGAFSPFFSPDGERVAFFAKQKLWRVSFSGDEPVEIADAPAPNGGSWGEDDSIIFSPSLRLGLARVPAAGGPVEILTTPQSATGDYGHAWPQWLPDGRHVLFSIYGAEEDQLRFGTAVLSLDTGTWNVVVEDHASGGRYVESGHLLYTYGPGSQLMSVPFDLKMLEIHGTPAPVLDVYYQTGRGHSPFAVSRTGTLVFNPEDPAKRTLVWVDRNGFEMPLAMDQGDYEFPRLSPDGKRMVFESARDLWIVDLERGTRNPLTSEAFNSEPVWGPEGGHIFFSSNRSGTWRIYSKSIRGTDAPEIVARGEHPLFSTSVSIDGTIAATENNPVTGWDIWTIPPEDEPQSLVVSPFSETQPQLSPDGSFLAYVSDESGQPEVYVQPYPLTGDRWSVSTAGGTEPLWSPDGRELFYRHGNTIMAVDIETATGFEPGIPHPLFDGDYLVSRRAQAAEYDISPDGQRFLMVRREPGSIPTRINVILNWTEELKRLVPTSN